MSGISDRPGAAPFATVARVARGQRPLEPLRASERARLAWTLLRHQAARHWVRTTTSGAHRSTADFRLFGLVTTWMEGDVIEATVRNLFRQGCERVYVVDNDSPDDTVAVAQRSGATLAARFRSALQDEWLLRTCTNQVAADVDRASWETGARTPIWWLNVDADEFPHGPGGITVREYVAGLAPEVRVVGSEAFDHWPTAAPAYTPGGHPADDQPWCTPRWSLACDRLHWKHQLVRHDLDRPTIVTDLGCHRALSVEAPLVEAALPIVVHHFPFREEGHTRARLDALGSTRADGTSRLSFNRFEMSERAALVDAVYAGRWAGVPSLNPLGGRRRVRPAPMDEVIPRNLREFARWY